MGVNYSAALVDNRALQMVNKSESMNKLRKNEPITLLSWFLCRCCCGNGLPSCLPLISDVDRILSLRSSNYIMSYSAEGVY